MEWIAFIHASVQHVVKMLLIKQPLNSIFNLQSWLWKKACKEAKKILSLFAAQPVKQIILDSRDFNKAHMNFNFIIHIFISFSSFSSVFFLDEISKTYFNGIFVRFLLPHSYKAKRASPALKWKFISFFLVVLFMFAQFKCVPFW